MKKLTIGYSPCPNDTFIFDALVHNRIDTKGYEFIPVLDDVEQLNFRATRAELDITKISVGGYAQVSKQYIILDSGSALGHGVGPVIVSKHNNLDLKSSNIRMIIPGKNTTANLLLSIFFPDIKNKTVALFSDIEDMLLKGKYDAGLLIHEGRFTYQNKGLHQLVDLGHVWEQQLGTPIPLGCICASRNIDINIRNDVTKLITDSINYAFSYPDKSAEYVRQNADELDIVVIKKHIALYVNNFSLALGAEGRSAIGYLLKQGYSKGILPDSFEPVFNFNDV